MHGTETGYICEKAIQVYEGKEYELDIDGNYYVYAGDENFMLCFYKSTLQVIHNNNVLYSRWNFPFISETFYVNGISIKVEHLDKNLYYFPIESMGTWKNYVKENWFNATGNEKIGELYNGYKRYKWFFKALKRNARWRRNPEKYDKYRTNRWLATWEYNGNKYEVIFGYGIDPDEETWERIKFDDENGGYGFTDIEREIIDSWFAGN